MDRDRKAIVVRPNDRVIRSILSIIGLAWWCDQSTAFIRATRGVLLIASIPVFVAVSVLTIAFLLWLAWGSDVLMVDGGQLRHERRIGILRLWPARNYPVMSLRDLRAEETIVKIKGNTSRRFAIVFGEGVARKQIVWRRTRIESDELVRKLRDALRRASAGNV
jgi:hypothetical protein